MFIDNSQQEFFNKEKDNIDFTNRNKYDEADPGLIKLQLDVESTLKRFENEILRGKVEVVDENTGKVSWIRIAPNEKPPVNELGVRELMARLKSKVGLICRLSNKTEEEIYKDMFYFDMGLTELIAKRCDKWEMDIEIAKSIKDSIIELVWDLVAGSRDGFTAINLRSQYQRQDISRVDSQDSVKKTFLGIPIGGRR